MADKTDLIREGTSRPGTWYRQGRTQFFDDLTLQQRESFRNSAVRVDWLDSGVNSLADAVAKAGEAPDGVPGDPSAYRAQSTVHLMGGGQGLRISEYTSDDSGLGDVYELPPRTAWSEPFVLPVKRFINSTTKVVALAGVAALTHFSGTAPVETIVRVPCAMLYRQITTSTFPDDLTTMGGPPGESGGHVGEMVNVTGVPTRVLKHFPDVEEYRLGNSNYYRVTYRYEWRPHEFLVKPTNIIVNAWETHYVDVDNTIRSHSPSGAP